MSDTNNTRTEWGVRLTWPDGHVEVRTSGNYPAARDYSRRDAEGIVHSLYYEKAEGETEATAEVVCRTYSASEWEPADNLTPDRLHDNTFVEWGVRLTWPDGHVEVDTTGTDAEGKGAYDGRFYAESAFRSSSYRLEQKESVAVPEVVGRYVTISEWTTPAERPRPSKGDVDPLAWLKSPIKHGGRIRP